MKNKRTLISGFFNIAVFVLWTFLIKNINVESIGPNNSFVGFSSVNRVFHSMTGVNMNLYIITDWLGLVPIFFMFGFAILGFIQLLKRKSLWKVDSDILALGGFYIAMITAYFFFEHIIINYRPVLLEGILEVSYPSSTTLLVMCVMPTTAIQFNRRIKDLKLRKTLIIMINIFTVFMVLARIFSGVHWITDIIGGILLSTGLVLIYYSIVK